MTLGGFAAYVRCTTVEVSGGLLDTRVPFVSTHMKFRGRVAMFKYEGMRNDVHGFPKDVEPTAEVSVRFTEKQELEQRYTTHERVIGTLSFWKNEKGPHDLVGVDITLPVSMLVLLQSMRNDEIKIDTIHEFIKERTADQQTDRIVALVKRIYFAITVQHDDDTKTRRRF